MTVLITCPHKLRIKHIVERSCYDADHSLSAKCFYILNHPKKMERDSFVSETFVLPLHFLSSRINVSIKN